MAHQHHVCFTCLPHWGRLKWVPALNVSLICPQHPSHQWATTAQGWPAKYQTGSLNPSLMFETKAIWFLGIIKLELPSVDDIFNWSLHHFHLLIQFPCDQEIIYNCWSHPFPHVCFGLLLEFLVDFADNCMHAVQYDTLIIRSSYQARHQYKHWHCIVVFTLGWNMLQRIV